MTSPPEGICHNCFVVWRARRPQPPGVYCHHLGTVARPSETGWTTEPAKNREALEQLRREGIR